MKAASVSSADTPVPNNNGWLESGIVDWNTPNQLIDWEGNILPAPVEWDGRRPCTRDDWAEDMTKFINENSGYANTLCRTVKALNITCLWTRSIESSIYFHFNPCLMPMKLTYSIDGIF